MRDSDGEATTNVALGRHRRRWLAPSIAAALLLSAAVVVARGRESGGSRPVTAPTSLSSPATTGPTTAPARTTTALYSQVRVGSPLLAGANLVVYAGTSRTDVLRISLGTGEIDRRRVDYTNDRPGPWAVLGRGGGVALAPLAFGNEMAVYGLGDGRDGTVAPLARPEAVDDGHSVFPHVFPAAEPDEIWVWYQDFPRRSTIRRMRLDGTVTAGPVDLPAVASVASADGSGAVALTAPEGLYHATVDGTSLRIEQISRSAPVVSSAGTLLEPACTDTLDCHLQVVDRESGESRVLPTVPDNLAANVYGNVLSADGRWWARIVSDQSGLRLEASDLTAGNLAITDQLDSNFPGVFGTSAMVSFSEDSQWLVWLDGQQVLTAWRAGGAEAPQHIDVPELSDIITVSLAPMSGT